MSADRPPESNPPEAPATGSDPTAMPQLPNDPPPPGKGAEPDRLFRWLKGCLIALLVLVLGAVLLGLLVLGTCFYRR